MGGQQRSKNDTGRARKAEASPLRSKTAWVLVWFALLSVAMHVGPRVLGLGDEDQEGQGMGDLARSLVVIPGHVQAAPMPAALSAGAAATVPLPQEEVEEGAAREAAPPAPVDAPAPGALSTFFGALARSEAREEGAVTRIVHYGDSMLTGDAITGAVRRLLQERFGDAGHGFVLAGRPWPWYMHRGVRHWGSNGWDVYRITSNPLLDGCLGLGGVAFRSIRPGARFYVEPTDGARVARFELLYLAHPRGGRLRVEVDGEQVAELDTRHDSPESRYHAVPVPDGQHRMTVHNAGGGQVRVFGVSMERPGPGVRYDSLGVNGLHASNFDRISADHLAEQVRHRAPHLIVVMLGTNESANRSMSLERHGEQYTAMLRRIRAGAPEASCLVMSPPDRAMRTANGRPATYRIIPRIVARQREVAEAEGCAFFDTYESMGGEGSAARWRYRRPVLMGGDLTHPTDAGAEVIGQSLFDSLMEGYERSRAAATDDRSEPGARAAAASR